MQGVVSLLDDRHYARVEAIWEELGQKFDVRGMYVTPYPHFSFQVAEQYDEEACEAYLKELAARSRPFRVRTVGLGVFTVANPILYIPVVRGPALSEMHGEIWQGVRQTTPGAVAHYYSPDEWTPHITLAQGDIDPDKLAEVIRLLSRRNFHWELTINNLALIYDTGKQQGVRCRFDFGCAGR
ncbi:MAG TPA: 2'-5' RNA ligase family protein [Pyrinomonadaceae bacterium]|jgi:2'-5' RNA ligase|nr:2'-5' RNA ligase family protein [Pyrinomonadaceae bacterium]